MASALADLDELVLLCRDKRAKAYISEAVACYRGGAYRSAIVATWIAVCFDIIDKLHELMLSGDAQAKTEVDALEETRKTANLPRALKFERDILEMARDKFELISPLEFIDLDRLRDDRNRCAHPSLISEAEAYLPSAELARAHIHAAVTHLLQHPPAQGKLALESLIKTVTSDYFPSTSKDAIPYLNSSPLRKPRHALVRNFTIVLLKSIIDGHGDAAQRRRYTAAFVAVRVMHRVGVDETLAENLSVLFRNIPDEKMVRSTRFLMRIKDVWQFFEPDVRQRITNYVEALPTDNFDDVEQILDMPQLAAAARKRIAKTNWGELSEALFLTMPDEVIDMALKIYFESQTFADANSRGKQLRQFGVDLNEHQVRRILTEAGKNSQITGSRDIQHVLIWARDQKRIPRPEFLKMMEENGLEEFAEDLK